MTALMTTPSSGSSSITRAAPRFATPRRPDRPTYGPQIAHAAKMLGTPLMPWQADFADVLGEYDPDTGIPFYRQAFYTVPRQSGKTALGLGWVYRLCMSAPNRRLAWSAQTGKDARDKWTDELFPLIENSRASKVTKRLHRGVGSEKIELNNGSLVRLVSNSSKSGHGKTIHGDFQDEIFADVDAWRQQAFQPGMLTIPEAQELLTSTAGTAASTIYNNLRKAGREAVSEGQDYGLCYLEYSADKDWDFQNPDTYAAHMPAIGHTITERSAQSAINAMLLDPKEGQDGVRRAFGNITAGVGEGTIPQPVWERVCSRTVVPDGKLTFAVAVAQDRSASSIGVCDELGRYELIENRGGTGWVVERANALTKGTKQEVVLDGGGPAGALADQINNSRPMSGSDVIDAHGAFFDAVVEATGIEVRQDTALDRSVEGAVKKIIGDRWVWSRKSSTEDITPLETCTLAWAGSRNVKPPRDPNRSPVVSL